MLKARMEYGAVFTKVMAMHGKILKEDDWRRLCDCKSLNDILSFLRNHKGWGDTISKLPTAPTTKLLHTAINRRVYEDHEKLYKYLSVDDKKYFRVTLYRAEYDIILSKLKEKSSLTTHSSTNESTDYVEKHSDVNLSALEQSKNMTEILSALRGSIFEKPLTELKVNPKTGMPDYREAGVALENVYYRELFSYIKKRYRGLAKKKLLETVGLEADLMNIVSIIRLHRSFPTSLERAGELLIPISHHLKPELLDELKTAKSENELLELLKKSPFGRNLGSFDTAKIEDLYYKSMERFCNKLIMISEPDLSVPQAYMVLKELECEKLNRVIEAVSSGVDPRSVI